MTAPHQFKAGDRLFYVPNDYGRPRRFEKTRDLVVVKVGRRWIECRDPQHHETSAWRMRFDRESLAADAGGYSSPGRAWPSEAAWRTYRRAVLTWDRIRGALATRPRDVARLPLDALDAIERALELPPLEETE